MPRPTACALDRRQRSAHRGERAAQRLVQRWPNLLLVHLPIHASWLNQVEIYFSIVQRKVLRPSDFASLFALEDRLLAFQDRYQQSAVPFEWKYTQQDLSKLLARLARDQAA